MTSLPANISRLRQRMIDDMRMRQLAPKTQDIYLHIVREFARFLGRSPHTATVEDLRRYQLYLVDHGTSAVSLNHAITGLKFFFTVTLDRPELMVRMQPVRVPRILPVVLSPDEVRRLIEAAGNLKHQTALSVAYGAGLRTSEVVELKVTDIDSSCSFRRACFRRAKTCIRFAATSRTLAFQAARSASSRKTVASIVLAHYLNGL